jgi:hypothetical protein
MVSHQWPRQLAGALLALVVACSGLSLIPGRTPVHAAGGALGAVPATKIVIFHPAGTTGATRRGTCDMGESLALDRSDAWRCMVGNEIYDPCFSLRPHAGSVICDADPTHPTGFVVVLPAPLPTHGPAHEAQAWMIKLGNGVICGFFTGATGAVANLRINYGCTDKTEVIGNPQPVGAVQYATVVKVDKNYKPVGIFAISIATIWK